jgi:hypothetical protein
MKKSLQRVNVEKWSPLNQNLRTKLLRISLSFKLKAVTTHTQIWKSQISLEVTNQLTTIGYLTRLSLQVLTTRTLLIMLVTLCITNLTQIIKA